MAEDKIARTYFLDETTLEMLKEIWHSQRYDNQSEAVRQAITIAFEALGLVLPDNAKPASDD